MGYFKLCRALPLDMAATGSVFSPSLGLHVHVRLEEGALTALRIARAGLPSTDDACAPLLDRIARHLETGKDDLRDVHVRLPASSAFDREVLFRLRDTVPPGRTITYGELAGGPQGARAVGGAMARNPIPLVLPCHRVLPAGRALGSYSAEGGIETKRALLRIEGALWF